MTKIRNGGGIECFGYSIFEFWYCFGFRYSDFGFIFSTKNELMSDNILFVINADL